MKRSSKKIAGFGGGYRSKNQSLERLPLRRPVRELVSSSQPAPSLPPVLPTHWDLSMDGVCLKEQINKKSSGPDPQTTLAYGVCLCSH